MDADDNEEGSGRSLSPPVKIENHSNGKWRVRVRMSPGAPRYHVKNVRGNRADACRYARWFIDLHGATGVRQTVSQGEL